MKTSTRTILLLLIASHIGLAIGYAFLTPYRTAGILLNQRDAEGRPAQVPDVGAPDERQHANYVQWLSDGRGFPVFDPDAPDLYESYQSHQPPAYYVLATVWHKILGSPDLTDSKGGVRLRLLNALIGAGTVAGVFFFAFWGTRREEYALLAAAFAALLPMHTALSGAVSNDPLLYCLCTWAMATALLCFQDGWTWKRAVALGVLTGLAFLTKTTAIALIPPLLVGLLLTSKTNLKASKAGAAAGLALLIAIPWWLRNQSLYGDPLAMGAFQEAFSGSPQAQMFMRAFGPAGYWLDWVGWWTARSFIGAFGYMDIFLSDSAYRVILVVLGIITLGGFLRGAKEWPEHRVAYAVSLTFFLTVFALFLRFNNEYFQGQARYLFPAIAPISLWIALGITFYAKNTWKLSLAALAGLLLALNVYILSILPVEFARRVI